MKGHSTGGDKKGAKVGLPGREGPIRSITPPYRASWVDRLVEGIKGLPIPSWLFYPGLCLVMTLALIAGSWIDGSVAFGQLGLPALYAIVPVYPVGLLAAMHYVDDTARRSFDTFRPALGLNPAEARQLQYDLTTLPAREAWLAAVAGAGFGVLVVVLSNVGSRLSAAPAVVSMVIAVVILGFSITAEFFYHTVRQLRLVSHIHSVATAIDLFQLTPLHAFSRLSAQTGLIFLLVLYFDISFNAETYANPALLALNALALPLIAVACFVLPLAGMHGRQVREKQRLQREVNQRLEATVQQLYQRADAMQLRDADAMNKIISSLVMTRELIAKIPTWPWQPGTFTLFFSAVTLPVIVFLIQMFLKGLLGFK